MVSSLPVRRSVLRCVPGLWLAAHRPRRGPSVASMGSIVANMFVSSGALCSVLVQRGVAVTDLRCTGSSRDWGLGDCSRVWPSSFQ